MRLLLDEGAPEELARLLRVKGHNVTAVAELPELRAAGDRYVLARAIEERRALLTPDVTDYLRMHQEQDRLAHYGLLFTPLDRLLPGNGVAALVRELEVVFEKRPDDASDNALLWLGHNH